MVIETANTAIHAYDSELSTWRETLNESLAGDNGWLSVIGLFWLHEGIQTIGSQATNDILIASHSGLHQIGFIDLQQGVAKFQKTTFEPVIVAGKSVQEAVLLDDTQEDGPTIVEISTISFYVIKRGERYGIRVRDTNSAARRNFQGRQWFNPDSAYQVTAKFIQHPTPCTVTVDSALGVPLQMENLGYVEFAVQGQSLRLDAFEK